MAKAVVANAENESGLKNSMKAFPQRTKSFFGDVRNELRKVSSPSRKEVQATTTVVIITVFIFGAYFWAVDGVIGLTLDKVFRTLSHR